MCIGAAFVCNGIFFAVSMQKHIFLQKYTSHIPKFSKNDIFVISKATDDLLNPKSFSFPYKENINNHRDVLMVSSLAVSDDGFTKAKENPEILVISLKEGVSEKKWIDTFQAKDEYVAVHSSRYKYLYNKAIIARNEALYSYFSLLSYISMISYLGIIFCAGIFPVRLYKELTILLLEGIDLLKSIFTFSLFSAALSIIVPFAVLFGAILAKGQVEMLLNLFVQSVTAGLLTAVIATSVTLLVGRKNFVKNRIL